MLDNEIDPEVDSEWCFEQGECPLDRGGYFIVKGTEKVILIQEQLSKNRIIIDTDKKGCVHASVMSSTEAQKSKTVIVMEKEKIYLSLNQFEKKVPMGMESDQEVVQMFGRDLRYGALLLPSIEECASHHVYTQQEALEFLEGKVAKSRFYSASVEKEGRAMVILRDVFVANIPVRENDFRLKCMYVAVMLRRMMEAIINKDAMDDKYRRISLLETINKFPFHYLFTYYHFQRCLRERMLGVEELELMSAEELHAPNSYLIILNGLILGKHRRPKQFAQAMRKL
ncbi:DNA-directed RNA polymerase [Heracleum sosnowskyi]|uniref:DNA-directed RNA polymerase n=1 Tax=Heracleum sosnowskyi TaxID=360622 RepID=A0AAD8I5F7_9APIA|nr:DNA-directed RNA polymerase [Heracleum sosnowskyi]